MTTMRGTESILDKPAAELEELLLQAARADAAPAAARDRALENVASAALGLGALSGAAALGSRGALLKGTGWLVAKWLALGAGSGLLVLEVAQGVQELTAKPASDSLSAQTSTKLAVQLTPRALPLAAALSPALPAEAEPAPESAVSATPPPNVAPATPLAREPKTTSRLPSSTENRRSSLTRELSLLEQVRSALALHSARSALQTLDAYHQEFPHGSMQVEAAALRIEAISQSGDHAQAQRLAQAFFSNFPASPLAARVRAVSEVSEADEQKP